MNISLDSEGSPAMPEPELVDSDDQGGSFQSHEQKVKGRHRRVPVQSHDHGDQWGRSQEVDVVPGIQKES